MNTRYADQRVTLARQMFALGHLPLLRQLVGRAAHRAGLSRARAQLLILAVNEAATNVIRHAGGTGQFELILDDGRSLVALVRDEGPGLPREFSLARPAPHAPNGRGLWLIHETCDRVDVRTGPGGTTISLEMTLSG